MAGLTRTQFEERNDEATRLVERIAFLRDAFDGSGGFASLPLSQTVSSNGSVANIPDWATTTYLLKHEGENWKQFEARRLISRYVNHVRRGIGHLIGLLVRRAPTRKQDQHPAIQALLTDCDGAGTTWDSMRERALTRAALYPGIPWTVDRPFDPGARTAAENKGLPRFSLREPDTLRDWRIDSQRQLLWAKFVDELDEKKGPTDEGREYLQATIWYRDKFEVWEMETSGNTPPSLKRREKNKLGVVPAGVLTFADAVCVADLFGWSPGGEMADVAGADFNDLSRLTDFLARGTFPMFLVPVEPGDQEEVQELEVGTMTAYGYPKDSGKSPDWARQDPHPIDAHNKRREVNEAECLRAGGLDSLLRTTNIPTSGLARKYENQHLDGSLRRVGQRSDRWERDVVRLWLLLWGETPERADKILAEYGNESPESYDIEDLDSLILQAQGAIGLPGTDPYTQKAILTRVSDAIAKLSPEEKEEREKYLTAQLEAGLIGETDDDGNKVDEDGNRVDDDGNIIPAQAPDATDAGAADAGVLLAAADKSAVVTVNEVRVKMGLGDLVLPGGKRDPDGDLTVQDFIAKREALREAQKQATGTGSVGTLAETGKGGKAVKAAVVAQKPKQGGARGGAKAPGETKAEEGADEEPEAAQAAR